MIIAEHMKEAIVERPVSAFGESSTGNVNDKPDIKIDELNEVERMAQNMEHRTSISSRKRKRGSF